MSFTHLHVHSHYSLLDGLSKIPDLVGHAKKLGMTSLALTDHGSLYGAVEFYQECKKQGIKPIIGVELYVAPRKLTDKQPKLDTKPYHLVVLAETIEGYNNLLSIVSKAHLDGYYYKPRVDIDLLNKYSTGLIALSSCLNGEVAKALVNKNIDAAEEVVRKYQDVFGQNNFFLEAQHNPTIPEQQIVNNGIIELSKRTGAELVATADSHYLLPDDAEAQDILVCIQTKHQLADEKRLSMRAEDYSLASPQQMQSWFPDMPEAVQNTDKIAARCNIELPLNEIHMPYYELPIGKTADEVLRELCIEGIEKRYQITNEAISKRLDYELSIINKTGYASYFLIVQDLVNWAKEQGIVVGPGRGSAAGSIVAYLTSITNIDPIKYDLLFERFLNPERVSMPDIDLDIADIRRDEVISYVEEKYGKDHVAQIITFGTMAARAAVRDVGRVLGISYGYCDTIAKLIPMFTNLDEAMKTVPELRDLYQSDPDAMRLLDGARKLEGVVRHTSTHACGVVITEKPLENYTPVQYSSASDDAIITQYSLHPVEALGLLKMDFLGLKNLTIIEDALGIIKKTTDEVIDIEKITLEDKKTYKLLKEGHTTGIFQLESAGMKRYLRTLKPTEFEDIIAMVALYRPGPMERIPDYVDGKHGRREIRYLHPDLKPILEKTYGILVYQEQVMAMVRDLAGFTAGEGYLLIKAVAKKISKLLNEQEAKFISGCEKNGISKNIADKLWAFIEPFAKYGFNKSHSTGYALIAYQTAYLKANYAPQFMASLLTADQDDSDRIAIEVQEARDMGITVMPPDINESFSTFTVVKESLSGKPRIRFGLAAIKNVGQKLVTAIIAERKSGGPFKSIEDLLKRIHQKDLNKKSLESLIKSGSFDGLDESSRLLHNLETLLIYNKQVQSEKASGQTNIFGQLPVENTPQLHFKESGLVDERQKLQWEKELLGLYVSAHPLEKLKDNLPASLTLISDALKMKARSEVEVVGIINNSKQIVTRKGETMQFVQLEDASSLSEVVIFPSAIENVKTVLNDGDVIKVTGSVSKRNGETKIIAEEIVPFSSNYIKIVLAKTSSKELIPKIHSILKENQGDLPVYVDINGKSIQAQSNASKEVVSLISDLLGEEAVFLV